MTKADELARTEKLARAEHAIQRAATTLGVTWEWEGQPTGNTPFMWGWIRVHEVNGGMTSIEAQQLLMRAGQL